MRIYTNIQQKNNVILERYIEDGVRKQREIPYQPTLYINRVRKSTYKTIKGESLETRGFNALKEARTCIQRRKKVENGKELGRRHGA